jgi:hypothetical protein
VLFGRSGNAFSANITIINDLANLPTSSANDNLIESDLSALSQTTGNFLLVSVTTNGLELVPEPSTGLLLASGLLGTLAAGRRRSLN